MSKKTVVDAVNELHGSLKNCKQYGTPFQNIAFIDGEYWISTVDKTCSDAQFVCTRDAFLQCVAEMSEGLFVPDFLKQPEIQYDKDGNGWEVGAVYEFSNDKKDWYQASFSRLDRSDTEYKPHGLNWHLFARECQSPIGKIHRKPVELVDGAAYQFECNGNDYVGKYVSDRKSFFEFANHPNKICGLCEAKNIIRLVPEVK